MAGKMARKEPGTSRARASAIKAALPAEEALARATTPPEALAASGASQLDETEPCTRSHVPNARTRKTLRDADAGKNLTRYTHEDDLFRKLGIELGQNETQAED